MSLTHRLHLLGTVHQDPMGYRRLTHFLREHQPDLLLVELSPYGLEYRLKHARELPAALGKNLRWAARQIGIPVSRAFRHAEIQAIRRQLALPFEYRASMKYASARHETAQPRVKLVDSSNFSREMILSWVELTSRENLVTLLSLDDHRPSFRNLYSNAHKVIFGEECVNVSRCSCLFPERRESDLLEQRERELAGAVMEAMRTHRPSRPLYVGGWQHLARDRCNPTLRDFLHVDTDRCHLLSGRYR